MTAHRSHNSMSAECFAFICPLPPVVASSPIQKISFSFTTVATNVGDPEKFAGALQVATTDVLLVLATWVRLLRSLPQFKGFMELKDAE